MFPRKLALVLAPAVILSAQTPTPKTAPGTLATPAPAAGAPAAVAPDKVVLAVGDTKITAAQYESMIDALPEQYRTNARGPQKRQFVENYLRMKLLAEEARKRNLQSKPEVQQQIAFQTDQVLASQAFTDIAKTLKVTDADVQKYYDEHKGEYEQVKARHILIRFKGSQVPVREGQKELTDEEALAKAQDLRKRILAGEDFAAAAKANSDDTGSGAQGGDLGSISRGQTVPAFETTAFAMKVGEVSSPIKTQFGYHLIKVEQHDNKTLAQVKDQIEQQLKPELARQAIENLKKTTTVTVDDAFFGPAGAEK